MNYAGDSMDGMPVELVEEKAGWVIPTRRKLAIVGSHPATRENAPYDDPAWEIWLFNESPQKPEVYRRWDASFQMHQPEVYASTENWVNKDHWNWLQQNHGNKKIWMIDRDERVPNSIKYPLDDVLTLVPHRYLRSTPALALALAIYLGYDTIALYGSDLTSNTEYSYQAINYAFWIGFAYGHGVDLRLECWQSEFNQPVYGYDGELELPRSFYEQRINELSSIASVNDKAHNKVSSKLQQAMLANNFDKVGALSLNAQNIALAYGEALGALSEAKRYHSRTNPISRQEFERVAAQAQRDAQAANDAMNHAAGKCEYVWNVWRQTGNNAALQQLRQFLDEKNTLAIEAGRLVGVYRENAQYMLEYDNHITAAGGVRALHQAEKAVVECTTS